MIEKIIQFFMIYLFYRILNKICKKVWYLIIKMFKKVKMGVFYK